MKSILVAILLTTFALDMNAQVNSSFTKGFNDELVYQVNGYKAIVKNDIFESLIFSDNQGNKVSYNKEFLRYIADNDLDIDKHKPLLLNYLIRKFQNTKNFTEKYEVTIMEELKYTNNKKQQASLRIDIFDNLIYKDNQGNQLKISEDIIRQNYRTSIKNRRFQYIIFSEMVNNMLSGKTPTIPPYLNIDSPFEWIPDKEDPREERSDAIFEYRESKHWASIRINKDGEKFYEDSTGNYFIFSDAAWSRNCRKYRSEKAFFDHLTKEYFIR